MINWKQILQEIKSIAIVGESGTGKTALALDIVNSSIKPVYVFKHPKKELLRELGYRNLESFAHLENLNNIILFIDEPQLYIELYSNKANTTLGKVLSLCRQRDITLILATSDTRFITRGIESYIQVWIVKDLEYDLVKQGSMIKKIIKENTFIDPKGFKCNVNEFVFYSRSLSDMNGKHTHTKPIFFDDRFSKPYAVTPTKSENETPTKSEKKEMIYIDSNVKANS